MCDSCYLPWLSTSTYEIVGLGVNIEHNGMWDSVITVIYSGKFDGQIE